MKEFYLIIQNIDASMQWEIPYDNFSIVQEKNADRSAQFSFRRDMLQSILDKYSMTPYQLFKGSYREAYLYDEDDNLIYSGFVDEMQTNSGMEDSGTVSITSKGFFSLLHKRITSVLRTYSAQDAGDIAWDLINYTQGLTYGALGITRGVHPATINRDRTYRFEYIDTAIEGLSNKNILNGFDFEITNEKVFNIFYPEKGDFRSNIIIEYGHNIDGYQITENGLTGLVNQAVVIGENFGDDIVSVTRDAENDYKAAYGLLQETVSEKDVQEAATLQDKGDKFLANWKFPRKTINVDLKFDSPLFTNYEVGDRIKVKIAQENVDEYYRVERRTLDDAGKVNLTLYPI
jgi:uncharacterized protein YbjQ (UPF0145 family)